MIILILFTTNPFVSIFNIDAATTNNNNYYIINYTDLTVYLQWPVQLDSYHSDHNTDLTIWFGQQFPVTSTPPSSSSSRLAPWGLFLCQPHQHIPACPFSPCR